MTAVLMKPEHYYNPLDVAEMVIMDRDWAFDRLDDGELLAEASGVWCNYRMWFAWQEEVQGLSVACSFDARIPKPVLSRVHSLLALVNEKLWIGHFSASSDEPALMFRHTLLLREGSPSAHEQIQDMLDIAMQECERFYPAFQAVIWAGKTPAEALEISLFETIAEA